MNTTTGQYLYIFIYIASIYKDIKTKKRNMSISLSHARGYRISGMYRIYGYAVYIRHKYEMIDSMYKFKVEKKTMLL